MNLLLSDSPNISLNRLFFHAERKLDDNSPYFLIELIVKSLGIKFDFSNNKWKDNSDFIIEYVNKIIQEDNISIPISNLELYLPDIALFVNPEISVKWKSSKNLIDAFWNIYNFTPKIPLRSNELFGFKTEMTPFNIDPIMVYQIAYYYKIPFHRETTLDKLQKDIIMYSDKLTPLRYSILSKLMDIVNNRNRKGLIDIKSYINCESPTTITASYKDGMKYPKTDEEAIYRAAKEYRWDISLSKEPLLEYIELDRVANDNYCPIDIKWKEMFDVNPNFFNLDHRYMEKYDNLGLYLESVKKNLIYRNGNSKKTDYLVFGGLNPYNLSTHGSDNLNKCKTAINLDSVSDIIKDPQKNHIILSTPEFIITTDELFDFWSFKKEFISPLDSSKKFSNEHVDMIKRNLEPNNKLRILIENIRKSNKEILEKSYEECNKNKLSIIFFDKLMKIALTIRGYKICYDEYPLSASFYDLEKYQNKIEKKVIQKIIKLLSNSSDFFNKIPLFTGRNIIDKEGSEDYYDISLYGSNLTVADIIKRMLNPSTVDGCIRTNSNFLLVTSWFYLKYLHESPFNISELRFIS